jgi:RNA polymerase sigma factor (sigma-70 family)
MALPNASSVKEVGVDRNDLGKFYADNMGLIHTVARKGYGRLQALGAPIDYDDLVQELSEVFIKAFDLFDEAAGAKFSTYFTFSAYNEINKIASRVERERTGSKVVSVEKKEGEYGYAVEREYLHGGMIGIEDINAAGEDGCSFEETVACDMPTPEEIVEAASSARALLNKLSPLAASIAKLAFDPPDFLEREFLAAQAHAEYARSVGIERRCRGTITIAFVATFLEKTTDLSAAQIRAAKNEIAAMAKRGI